MNFLQKLFLHLEKEITAGGIVHVPPSVCLLPANAPACVPAYVAPPGGATTNELGPSGTVRPFTAKGLILQLEPAP